jgi:hypothetical protein
VDQELLLRNEYLAAENRILQLKGRLRRSNAERAKLGEIAYRVGRRVLGEVANAAHLRNRAQRRALSVGELIVKTPDVARALSGAVNPAHGSARERRWWANTHAVRATKAVFPNRTN